MKITNVTHVRELNGLELQAVEMALEGSALADDAGLTLTLGSERSGGKTVPFVAIRRSGSKREVVVEFRDKDLTAEARRDNEAKEAGKNVTTAASAKARARKR